MKDDKDIISNLVAAESNDNIYKRTLNNHINDNKNYFEPKDILTLENEHWVMQYRYLILKYFLNNYMIKGGKTLDLGLGSGLLSKYISDNSKDYLGLDKNIYNLKFVKNNFDLNVDICNIETEDITNNINYYDNIICLNILEYMVDENLFMLKCNNAIKDSGKLIISIPTKKYKENLIDIKNNDKIINKYELEDIEKLLNNYNFKIDYYSYYLSYSNLKIINTLHGKSISSKIKKIDKDNIFNSLKQTIGETLVNKDLLEAVALDEDIDNLSKIHPLNDKFLKVALNDYKLIQEGKLSNGQCLFIVASKK